MAAQGPMASRNPALKTCIKAGELLSPLGRASAASIHASNRSSLLSLTSCKHRERWRVAGVSRMQRHVWQAS